MTAPAILDKPAADVETDDDVTHYWCCNPRVAYCGADAEGSLDDEENESVDPDDCPMCKAVKRGEFPTACCGEPGGCL